MAWRSSPRLRNSRARRLGLSAGQAQDDNQQQECQRQFVGEHFRQAVADGLGFEVQVRMRRDAIVSMFGIRFVGVDAGVLEVQLHRMLGGTAVEFQVTVMMQA